MTTAEILKAARALISDAGKWIKGADALRAPGSDDWGMDPKDPEAFCFCAGGAICRIAANDEEAIVACAAFARAAGTQFVYQFNDRYVTTHADVMAVFDRAIAAAEAQT